MRRCRPSTRAGARSSSRCSRRSAETTCPANFGIVVAKLAAVVTGSTALFAEPVHSAADTGKSVLLLVAQRRSRRPAPPSGLSRGREAYFWALLTPGGLGIVDGGLVAVLVAFGTSGSTAAAAVVLYRTPDLHRAGRPGLAGRGDPGHRSPARRPPANGTHPRVRANVTCRSASLPARADLDAEGLRAALVDAGPRGLRSCEPETTPPCQYVPSIAAGDYAIA
jgi:hypothetical protein